MTCSCGAQIAEGTNYCAICGASKLQNQQPYQGQPYQGQPYHPGQQYNPDQPYYPNQQNYYQNTNNQDNRAANSAATASLACGIIGFIVAGLILGIIAIAQGNKAKRLGYVGGKATAGIILGVIDIVTWAFIIMLMWF